MKYLTLAATLLIVATTVASDRDDGFVVLTPDDLVWQDLAPGVSFTVIEGDPGKEGYYIIRAKFAPGNMSRPHFHPNDRYVTVISGTWWAGTGPVQDLDRAIPLEAGSYMKHPAGAAHWDGSIKEEVIVEIKGMGPAPLVYVDSDGNPIEE